MTKTLVILPWNEGVPLTDGKKAQLYELMTQLKAAKIHPETFLYAMFYGPRDVATLAAAQFGLEAEKDRPLKGFACCARVLCCGIENAVGRLTDKVNVALAVAGGHYLDRASTRLLSGRPISSDSAIVIQNDQAQSWREFSSTEELGGKRAHNKITHQFNLG